MQQWDLGKMRIPRLFKIYFIPTLLGMISMSAVTAFDGIFIGRGVGSGCRLPSAKCLRL